MTKSSLTSTSKDNFGQPDPLEVPETFAEALQARPKTTERYEMLHKTNFGEPDMTKQYAQELPRQLHLEMPQHQENAVLTIN